MTRKTKIIALLGGLAGTLLFVTFVLPPILRSVAENKLTETLGRKTTIGEVAFNPFTLELTVRKLEILEPDGKESFVAFDQLRANLELVSIYRRAPVLSELVLDRPRVHLVRTGDSAYNFSDLTKPKEPEAQGKPEESPARFFIGNVRLSGGSIAFDNRPAGKMHNVSDIDLFIPVVSNLPVFIEEFSSPHLAFSFDGSAVRLEGKTKPFADTLETQFEVVLKDLDLTRYVAYSPVALGFELASAKLDTDLRLSYVQHRETAPTINLTGAVGLRELTLTEKGGAPLVSLARLNVEIDPSEVSSSKFVLKEILIDKPHLTVRRDKAGKLNLDVLANVGGEADKKPAAEKTSGEPLHLSVAKVRLQDGQVDFSDDGVWKPFKTTLSGMGAEVTGFELPAKTLQRAELKFQTESGEAVEVFVSGLLDPIKVDGGWKISAVKLPKYKPYYGEPLNFEVEKGVLDLAGSFHAEGAENLSVKEVSASLRELRLRTFEDKIPFFELGALELDRVQADLATRVAGIGKLGIRTVAVRAARAEDGTLSTDSLFKPTTPPVAEPSGAEKLKPWTVRLEELALDKGAVAFADRKVKQQASFEAGDITLRGTGLSNAAGEKGKISLKLRPGKKGLLSLDGALGVEPLSGDFRVDLKELDLTQLNPYIAEQVRLILLSGDLSVKGRATFTKSSPDKVASGFEGDLVLAAMKAVERESAEELIHWGSLSVNGVSFKSEPQKVSVQSLSVTDPYFRVDVGPDGVLNLSTLSVNQEETAAAPETKPVEQAPTETPLEIKAVALQGATIDFSDRHVSPNYRVKIVDLAGRITRMASDDPAGGEVTMLGSVDNYAPLEISGRLNPFAKDLLVDLKIDFRNVDLSPMTPYSSRYLGYKIAKGKLGLALQYKILGKKLDSQNKVLLDQLTLGDQVESPDATGLPVRFALALLTDRNGMIDLDVPVSGTLDDPDFSYGKVIWKVLVNILVKAATSPFALVGSLFGGGEELSYAVFPPAVDQVPAPEQGKLDTLAKALTERPALRLEIIGHVDPEKDRLALRDVAYERKLRAAKVKEVVRHGETAMPIEEVTIVPEERDRLIAMTFDQEQIPRPASTSRALTGVEMEKLILTHIQVSDDDLRQLADRRARSVLGYLIEKGKADPNRVFLTEPKALKPEPKENVSDCRVEFVLQ
jgi:uncharacterized protein involved in outer membrane biogenesis